MYDFQMYFFITLRKIGVYIFVSQGEYLNVHVSDYMLNTDWKMNYVE